MARSNRGGNCYEACGTLILLGEATGKLCHGEVFNPKSGRFHGHCWLENQVVPDGIVWVRAISGERDIMMPRSEYYELGRVRRVTRYTAEQVRFCVGETGRWGPWPKPITDLARSRQRHGSGRRQGEMGVRG